MDIENMEWHNNPYKDMEDASNPAEPNRDAAKGEEVDDSRNKSDESKNKKNSDNITPEQYQVSIEAKKGDIQRALKKPENKDWPPGIEDETVARETEGKLDQGLATV